MTVFAIIIVSFFLFTVPIFFLEACQEIQKRRVSHGRWSVGNGYQLTESEVTEGMNGEGEVGVCVGRGGGGIRLKPDD